MPLAYLIAEKVVKVRGERQLERVSNKNQVFQDHV